MSEAVNPQKLGSRGGPVTHLPLALHQLVHLTLLGLQDLLHLGAERQVPGSALGSREVSAPVLWNLRPSRAGLALPTLHLHPGLGSRVQDVPARRRFQDNFPGATLDCGNKEIGPEGGRTGFRGHSETSQRGAGGSDSALLTHLSDEGYERIHCQRLLLPHTGHSPAPLFSPQRSPGQGEGTGCSGELTSACSRCLSWRICCSISSYSCWTSRWWSESRLEGVGGRPGSPSAPWDPAAGRGGLDLSLKSIVLTAHLRGQWLLTPSL